MQLNRKTSGEWNNSRDFIGQDLDTIMRSFNQLQQSVTAQAALITALQAQLAAPNIAIAANGQVSGLSGARNLQTVAHDGTLRGLGTPASPLSAIAQSVSASGPLYTVSLALSTATVLALGHTYGTGTTLVAGVAGLSVMPVLWSVELLKGVNAWTTSPVFRILNNSVGNLCAGDITPTLNIATAGQTGGVSVATARNYSNASSPGNDPLAQDLRILTSTTPSQGTGGAISGSLTLWYVLMSST